MLEPLFQPTDHADEGQLAETSIPIWIVDETTCPFKSVVHVLYHDVHVHVSLSGQLFILCC